MADELITLTTYRFAPQADAAKWVLEQEGIQAFVADANIVTADWFLGNAVGYIKLQVRRSQAQAALEVLHDNPRLMGVSVPEERPDGAMSCLACGEPIPDDADRCTACGWSYESAGHEEDV
jgi:hypothetical protein